MKETLITVRCRCIVGGGKRRPVNPVPSAGVGAGEGDGWGGGGWVGVSEVAANTRARRRRRAKTLQTPRPVLRDATT